MQEVTIALLGLMSLVIVLMIVVILRQQGIINRQNLRVETLKSDLTLERDLWKREQVQRKWEQNLCQIVRLEK